MRLLTGPGSVLCSWLLGAALLGACAALDPPAEEGTGATDPPSPSEEEGTGANDPTGTSGQEDSGPNGSGSEADDDDEDLFSFSLPAGPETVAETLVDDVYIPLQEGDCETASSRLAEVQEDFNSPRTVLLYRAAIDLCRGDEAGARDWFAQADALGWSGIGVEYFVVDGDGVSHGTFRYDCEVYRSVRHVLDRVDRDSVSCPGGEPPQGQGEEETTTDPTTDSPTTDEPTGTTDPTTDEPTSTGDEGTGTAGPDDG